MLKRLFTLAVLFRSCSAQTTSAPVVDLGYARYQGVHDANFDLNVFNGIRYAAPPIGKLRWQPPQAPAENASQVTPAVNYAPQCPQTPNAPGPAPDAPSGDEDCLFLNIQAPANKKNLPVMVWIHGGGYGSGNSHLDNYAELIRTNGNAYIVVAIQYRMGAFGFLSSAELAQSGVPNAGIHDMHFALLWVQRYINLFGGDPTQVTVVGESAGGGAVMLLSMANGGNDGDALFKGIIASSPYLPTQWNFDGAQPSDSYNRFAERVGCLADDVVASNSSVFDCLVSADTVVLQNASAEVTASGIYGQWAFLPVTDGTFIKERPTEQLLKGGEVNGVRVLVGHNANEAVYFVPFNITSGDTFRGWLQTNYPLLSEENVTSILELYSVPSASSGILTNSDGQHEPFSTTNSGWAVGWQQAAVNLYAESTFVCPSYWLSDAYGAKQNKNAWHYQFSVPPAPHGSDLVPLKADPEINGTSMDKVFRTAFQQIWGNFIVHGDPTLSTVQTTTPDGGNITAAGSGIWPQWKADLGENWMLNLNMTGGVPVDTPQAVFGTTIQVTSYIPGNDSSSPLEALFEVVEGAAWEDGRGKRCQLWADLGPWIME
ncbi:alpha/beta-hydrolase [Whalleya microplaca]|nr:alpha/beta-hydrolase [Whalleya microplaca]